MQVYEVDFAVFSKKDASPVTEADVLANQILVEALQLRWPVIPVLSEESTDSTLTQDSRCYWAIDPLDGTKEFIQDLFVD
jgi:3'(2'), 5'-bisphosphate nucleotidase